MRENATIVEDWILEWQYQLLRIEGMVMHLMQNFGVLIVLRLYSTQVDNGRCQEITAASPKTSFWNWQQLCFKW
jgi:hypothetical protein